MIHNVKIDEYNLYNKLARNYCDFADKDWSTNDNTEFTDLNEFDVS